MSISVLAADLTPPANFRTDRLRIDPCTNAILLSSVSGLYRAVYADFAFPFLFTGPIRFRLEGDYVRVEQWVSRSGGPPRRFREDDRIPLDPHWVKLGRDLGSISMARRAWIEGETEATFVTQMCTYVDLPQPYRALRTFTEVSFCFHPHGGVSANFGLWAHRPGNSHWGNLELERIGD